MNSNFFGSWWRMLLPWWRTIFPSGTLFLSPRGRISLYWLWTWVRYPERTVRRRAKMAYQPYPWNNDVSMILMANCIAWPVCSTVVVVDGFSDDCGTFFSREYRKGFIRRLHSLGIGVLPRIPQNKNSRQCNENSNDASGSRRRWRLSTYSLGLVVYTKDHSKQDSDL